MRKKALSTICLTTLIAFQGISSTGCANSRNAQLPTETAELTVTAEPTAIPTPTIEPIQVEAETGTVHGKVNIQTKLSGFTGEGYITGFEDETDFLELTVNVITEGFYDLNFRSSSTGGKKENIVSVDGEKVGNLVNESNQFEDVIVERIYLTTGEHVITVLKSWGWINIDSLTLTGSEPIDESIFEVPATLINANATDNTKRLMSYLTDIYGEKILSGQYCDRGMYGIDVSAIRKENGNKMPAVLGLDFIEASPSRVANGSVSHATEYAIQFWEAGGIVTMCWHWNAPTKYITGNWYSAFYTNSTNIDIDKIMNGKDTEGYELLMNDIDAIAKELKALQDAGVPILWRPLHEASGGWFWWGAKGADAYKKLYILLYDKLTNEYGLNNLIWVWNGQNKEWYPGDEYVDIIGEDIYPGERVYASQIGKFLEANDYTSAKKMVVMSENGCLMDPDLALRDRAMWGFFATWCGEFVTDSSSIVWYSEKYNEKDMLYKVYNHDLVLTLDELPDLKTYTIHE